MRFVIGGSTTLLVFSITFVMFACFNKCPLSDTSKLELVLDCIQTRALTVCLLILPSAKRLGDDIHLGRLWGNYARENQKPTI